MQGAQIVRTGDTLTPSGAGEIGGAAIKSKASAESAESGQTVSSAFAIVVLRANQAPEQ